MLTPESIPDKIYWFEIRLIICNEFTKAGQSANYNCCRVFLCRHIDVLSSNYMHV